MSQRYGRRFHSELVAWVNKLTDTQLLQLLERSFIKGSLRDAERLSRPQLASLVLQQLHGKHRPYVMVKRLGPSPGSEDLLVENEEEEEEEEAPLFPLGRQAA